MSEKDYPFIRAWGEFVGSYPYYINNQIAAANEDDAPDDAIYKSHETGEWVRASSIKAANTKRSVYAFANKPMPE